MRTRMFFLLLLFSLGISTSIPAQDQKPVETDEVIRVDTKLVDIPVSVVSPNGSPIRSLKAENFIVFEDGKRQEIADFSAATVPFEVALLLDTSGSARADIFLIQRAAQEFVASLRPGDRVAVIAYRSERRGDKMFDAVKILTPLTDDRKALKAATDTLNTSGGTPYYDSLLQVAENVFGKPASEQFRGRRALVALTDGVDSTSAADFSWAKEKIEQLGIISFFIKVDTRDYFEDNLLGDCQTSKHFSMTQIRRYYRSIAGAAAMEKASNFCQLRDFERLAISKRLYQMADAEMSELAKNSGGKVFPADDLSEVRAAFRSVADEIGTKYTLGYYSSNEKRDGTYRKIKVELKGLPVGTQIRTREGYMAPAN